MERLISLNVKAIEAFSNSPEEILKEDIALQIAVASHPDTSHNILEALANSEIPEVAEAAQMHVNYDGELTEAWQDAVENKLKSRYLGQNDRLAVELLKIAPLPVYFLSEYVPPEYLIRGLNNPYLSKSDRLQLLTRLAQESTLEPRLHAAESVDTPIAVLEQLIGDLELSVRMTVQHNPNFSEEFLRFLEEEEIAKSWETTPKILTRLSDSKWDRIRLLVAQNPSTSEEAFLKLAKDKVFPITLAVAKNPVISVSVLEVLSKHPNKLIQTTVARHENATEEILHTLFDAQQIAIKSRHNLPASIIERIFNQRKANIPLWQDPNIKSLLLKQPHTPSKILSELADIDIEALTAEYLAQEKKPPRSTAGIHKKWVSDKIDFLVNIAQHPQVSVETLEKIIQYPNVKAKLAVAQNSKTPQPTRLRILKSLISSKANDHIKITIAEDVNTPVTILEKLANELSPTSHVLTKISQFIPNISPSLFNKLTSFIDKHQSPEQMLFWLRQSAVFREPILQDWNQLIDSLDAVEVLQLKSMSMIMMPAIGLSGGVPQQDRIWLNQSVNNANANPANLLENLPPNYTLYGLLILIGMSSQNDRTSQAMIMALLSNPTTPVDTRERLWQEHDRQAENNPQAKNDYLKLALASNPAIPENERQEYMRQAYENGYSKEAIAKHPSTPIDILEEIAKTGIRGIKNIAQNPNAPLSLLKEVVRLVKAKKSSGYNYILEYVAKNPNTSLDLLQEIADLGISRAVFKNPNLDKLTIYKIELETKEKAETRKAKNLLPVSENPPYLTNYSHRLLDSNYSSPTLNGLICIYDPAMDNLPTVLSEYANSDVPLVRFVSLLHPLMPEEVLAEGANSSSWIERYAVANNSNSPIEITQKLTQDSNQIVRAFAKHNL